MIDRFTLTEELKITLSYALAFDSTAREVRANGGEETERIAAGYEKYREAEVRSLWTFCGAKPPPDVTFDDLLIVR